MITVGSIVWHNYYGKGTVVDQPSNSVSRVAFTEDGRTRNVQTLDLILAEPIDKDFC